MKWSTDDSSEKSQQMVTEAAEEGRMSAHCCRKAACRLISEDADSFRSGISTGSLSLRVTITT